MIDSLDEQQKEFSVSVQNVEKQTEESTNNIAKNLGKKLKAMLEKWDQEDLNIVDKKYLDSHYNETWGSLINFEMQLKKEIQNHKFQVEKLKFDTINRIDWVKQKTMFYAESVELSINETKLKYGLELERLQMKYEDNQSSLFNKFEDNDFIKLAVQVQQEMADISEITTYRGAINQIEKMKISMEKLHRDYMKMYSINQTQVYEKQRLKEKTDEYRLLFEDAKQGLDGVSDIMHNTLIKIQVFKDDAVQNALNKLIFDFQNSKDGKKSEYIQRVLSFIRMNPMVDFFTPMRREIETYKNLIYCFHDYLASSGQLVRKYVPMNEDTEEQHDIILHGWRKNQVYELIENDTIQYLLKIRPDKQELPYQFNMPNYVKNKLVQREEENETMKALMQQTKDAMLQYKTQSSRDGSPQRIQLIERSQSIISVTQQTSSKPQIIVSPDINIDSFHSKNSEQNTNIKKNDSQTQLSVLKMQSDNLKARKKSTNPATSQLLSQQARQQSPTQMSQMASPSPSQFKRQLPQFQKKPSFKDKKGIPSKQNYLQQPPLKTKKSAVVKRNQNSDMKITHELMKNNSLYQAQNDNIIPPNCRQIFQEEILNNIDQADDFQQFDDLGNDGDSFQDPIIFISMLNEKLLQYTGPEQGLNLSADLQHLAESHDPLQNLFETKFGVIMFKTTELINILKRKQDPFNWLMTIFKFLLKINANIDVKASQQQKMTVVELSIIEILYDLIDQFRLIFKYDKKLQLKETFTDFGTQAYFLMNQLVYKKGDNEINLLNILSNLYFNIRKLDQNKQEFLLKILSEEIDSINDYFIAFTSSIFKKCETMDQETQTIDEQNEDVVSLLKNFNDKINNSDLFRSFKNVLLAKKSPSKISVNQRNHLEQQQVKQKRSSISTYIQDHIIFDANQISENMSPHERITSQQISIDILKKKTLQSLLQAQEIVENIGIERLKSSMNLRKTNENLSLFSNKKNNKSEREDIKNKNNSQKFQFKRASQQDSKLSVNIFESQKNNQSSLFSPRGEKSRRSSNRDRINSVSFVNKSSSSESSDDDQDSQYDVLSKNNIDLRDLTGARRSIYVNQLENKNEKTMDEMELIQKRKSEKIKEKQLSHQEWSNFKIQIDQSKKLKQPQIVISDEDKKDIQQIPQEQFQIQDQTSQPIQKLEKTQDLNDQLFLLQKAAIRNQHYRKQKIMDCVNYPVQFQQKRQNKIDQLEEGLQILQQRLEMIEKNEQQQQINSKNLNNKQQSTNKGMTFINSNVNIVNKSFIPDFIIRKLEKSVNSNDFVKSQAQFQDSLPLESSQKIEKELLEKKMRIFYNNNNTRQNLSQSQVVSPVSIYKWRQNGANSQQRIQQQPDRQNSYLRNNSVQGSTMSQNNEELKPKYQYEFNLQNQKILNKNKKIANSGLSNRNQERLPKLSTVSEIIIEDFRAKTPIMQ